MTTTLNAQNLTLQKNNRLILNDVDIEMKAGEVIGLVGPNGAGKTSLMRALMRFDPEAKGACNLWSLSVKDRARTVSWLAQERQLAWDMDVQSVIALGRIPWRTGFIGAKVSDHSKVKEAIETLELNDFKARRFANLSGGERARVLIARVLAQDTPFIMADEPIAALDPEHQIQVMEIFQTLAQAGKGVMLSIHDLGLAARFCTRLVLIHKGMIVSNGDYERVLSDENLKSVFQIEAFRGYADGPLLQPIRRLET